MKILKFKYYQILKRLGCKIPKHVVLEYAKETYLTKNKKWGREGMCYHIEDACAYFYIFPRGVYYFTKFNPRFCEAEHVAMSYRTYWWNARKKEPRIKAFDKLIKYYKEHKEYI